MKVSKIKPNPNNPRIIKDERFAKLVQSIKDFPKMMELRPMVINSDNIVLGGNMRLKAITELGMKEIPDSWVKKATDLTEEEARRFIIADNVGFGEHDWEVLANEWNMDELTDWGLEIPDFVNKPEATEDDYEIPDEIKTDIVKGDLFELTANGITHRLLCGDSTNADDVAKLMNGEKADMVFTSPPYNQGGKGIKSKGFAKEQIKFYSENGFSDNLSKEEYYIFLISVLKNISENCKEECSILWNVSYSAKSRDDYGKILFGNDNPFSIKETIIWDKKHAFNSLGSGILSRVCELIFLMSKSEKYFTNQIKDCWWNVWRIDTSNSQHENHKACFPVTLCFEAINRFSKEGLLIYEPFGGSGSTLVAAAQLNRRCFIQELDEKYCQVIIDRFTKLYPETEIKRNGVLWTKTGELQAI